MRHHNYDHRYDQPKQQHDRWHDACGVAAFFATFALTASAFFLAVWAMTGLITFVAEKMAFPW